MSGINRSATVGIQSNPQALVKPVFPAEVRSPDYKELISPGALRRMGVSVRMGVWCAMKCDVGADDPLIVATGLGCLADSEKFLSSIGRREGGELPTMVSPTPFIQSTHNVVAGQIALQVQNHAYNVTHVQDGHSFENALIDALLMLDETRKPVLVGAVDEYIPLLGEIAGDLGIAPAIGNMYTGGASFFRLLPTDTAVVIDQAEICQEEEVRSILADFGAEHIFVGGSGPRGLTAEFIREATVVYSDYCGIFMTNIAFGLDLAFRAVGGGVSVDGRKIAGDRISVLNCYDNRSFGVINIRKA